MVINKAWKNACYRIHGFRWGKAVRAFACKGSDDWWRVT